MRMIQGVKGFLALAALLAAGSAFAAADVLKEAEQLIADHKGVQAYELLAPLAETRAGDPAFDYLLGVAALDAKKPNEAVFALERVLDAKPDHAQARAELARAYFELGENDAAKQEFQNVKGQKLPSDVAATIDRYLSSIEQRIDTTRTRYDLFFETGGGYDSNVNSATDRSRVAIPALGGLVFALNNTGREQQSGVWSINGGFNFSSPLKANVNLFGGIDFDHRLAVSEPDFTTQTANGLLGVNFASGDDQYRISAQGQKFLVKGIAPGIRADRDLGGFNAQWQRTLSPTDQVTAFAQFAFVRYPDQKLRDVNRAAGGLGWGHAFGGQGSPVMYASVFGGNENELHDNVKQVGRDFVGARLGGQYTVNDKTTASASVNYEHSFYGGQEPLFLKVRDDDYYDVGAGLRYALHKSWSLRPEIRYSANNSPIPIFDYDRVEVMLTLRNDF